MPHTMAACGISFLAGAPRMSTSLFPPALTPGLSAEERREAFLRAEEERAAQRHAQIEAQSSPLLAPHERIRQWETLHGVNLPLFANHRLIRVIANSTALTIEQVRAEQQRRADAGS